MTSVHRRQTTSLPAVKRIFAAAVLSAASSSGFSTVSGPDAVQGFALSGRARGGASSPRDIARSANRAGKSIPKRHRRYVDVSRSRNTSRTPAPDSHSSGAAVTAHGAFDCDPEQALHTSGTGLRKTTAKRLTLTAVLAAVVCFLGAFWLHLGGLDLDVLDQRTARMLSSDLHQQLGTVPLSMPLAHRLPDQGMFDPTLDQQVVDALAATARPSQHGRTPRLRGWAGSLYQTQQRAVDSLDYLFPGGSWRR